MKIKYNDNPDIVPAVMTRREAAKYLNICVRSLDGLVAKKLIPTVRFGRAVRFKKTSIDKYINDCES